MFKPDPKPEKKVKEKMTSAEFRKKHGYKKSLSGSKVKSSSKSKKKKKTIYTTTAWIWFSRYIKLLHANDDGSVTCKTSKVQMILGDRNIHAGHCIKVYDANSTNFATAFDVRNVMPQTYQENKFYGGRSEVMRDEIDKYWGEGTYDELKIKAKEAVFYTKVDLQEISDKYRIMSNDIADKRGLRKWWNK